MKERAPEFSAIEGLIQDYDLADACEHGLYGDFYLRRPLDDVQQDRMIKAGGHDRRRLPRRRYTVRSTSSRS